MEKTSKGASLRETSSREPSPSSTGLGPSGFDPARLAETIEQIAPDRLAPIIKKAADEFYCAVLETAEDYLRDNLDWNIKSHIHMLERENQRMREEMAEVDRALGGMMLGQENRLENIRRLEVGCRRYNEMVWAVSQKHEGEERHETALRYIREREAASGMEATSLRRTDAIHSITRERAGEYQKTRPSDQ